MSSIILVIHLMIALAMIGVVLLQRSEGGALGIGGGGGGGGGFGGLMSGRGAANILTKTTAFLALIFFITSLSLSLIGQSGGGSVLDAVDTDRSGSGAGSPVLPLGDERTVAPTTEPAAPEAPAEPAVPLQQ